MHLHARLQAHIESPRLLSGDVVKVHSRIGSGVLQRRPQDAARALNIGRRQQVWTTRGVKVRVGPARASLVDPQRQLGHHHFMVDAVTVAPTDPVDLVEESDVISAAFTHSGQRRDR